MEKRRACVNGLRLDFSVMSNRDDYKYCEIWHYIVLLLLTKVRA